MVQEVVHTCHLRGASARGGSLQLVLLELLAWVGGAWRGREGQGLGNSKSDLGLSTMLGVLPAPRGYGVCIIHSQN